jgi:hypothetical protein
MAQTFSFEELDSGTHEYLTAVRDSQGEGAPGVFAPTTSAMAGCGCVSGVVVIAATLLLTLTTWIDLILKEPMRVAMLQTAGLLLGGWLLVAAIRSSAAKGSKSYAGHWVYVDSLHLYEAYREQVTVTPIQSVVEAQFTHNYNNGSYQNSVVRVVLGGGAASVTLNNEAKAEQIVVFLNYLAWARSREGGERATLPPAQLGGVARYVAEHDVEPKNHDETLDLDLVHSEIDAVPEEPVREGRAAPPILPYVLLVVAGLGIFFVMKEVVNPPLRDDAMFKAITEPEQTIEPLFLRVYLLDERNTRHRQKALELLRRKYDQAIGRIQNREGTHPLLNDGMIKLLEALAGPEQPAVSLMVRETGAKAGDAAAKSRVQKLRDDLVGGIETKTVPHPSGNHQIYVGKGGIIGELSNAMPPVKHPDPTVIFTEPRFPIGAQLIDFADKPEEADHAHIEVTYEFIPEADKLYRLSATVEFRTSLDGPPVVPTYRLDLPGQFTEKEFDQQLAMLKDRLVRGMVGNWTPQGFGGMPAPGFPIPN